MSQHCTAQTQSQNTVNILNMYVLQAVPAFSKIGFQNIDRPGLVVSYIFVFRIKLSLVVPVLWVSY
jgi:hypothetical protein